MHPGHIRLLEAARSLGDVLILALNTDAGVQRLKGPTRPLISQNDRAELAAALAAVDAVTFFGEDTPRELIAAVLPDVLVKGADWSHFIAGREEVEAAGGKVLALPLDLATRPPGLSKRSSHVALDHDELAGFVRFESQLRDLIAAQHVQAV